MYYYWHLVSEEHWRLNPDPVISARKFIIEQGALHHVGLLDITAAPGTEVLAFQVIDFMEDWTPHTQELGMDSTCKHPVFYQLCLVLTVNH